MIPGVSVLWNYVIYLTIAIVAVLLIIGISIGVTRYFCKPGDKELSAKVEPEPASPDKSVNSTSVTEIEHLQVKQRKEYDQMYKEYGLDIPRSHNRIVPKDYSFLFGPEASPNAATEPTP